MSEKPRSNGARSAPKPSLASTASRKFSKRQPSKNDKQKRGGATAKRKNQESGSTRYYTGTDADSSDEEDGGVSREQPQMPEIGDEIAIKCPPDPPYPEGWYTGVVIDVIVHDEEKKSSNSKAARRRTKSDKAALKNFTVQIEWDGGGDEKIKNPEWRLKGDAPDKHGRVSHRDAKLRPYFKYWVTRLNAMGEAEKKLSRTRAGKNTRMDPGQKVEWIQCCNPSCGKWRPLPPYMKSSAILESCSSKWYCVLNSWDEAHASCGAPQETGYMPRAP